MVTTRYSVQTVACSTVVWGEKLKTPLSTAPYQLPSSMVPETSNARWIRPGRIPAYWKTWNP